MLVSGFEFLGHSENRNLHNGKHEQEICWTEESGCTLVSTEQLIEFPEPLDDAMVDRNVLDVPTCSATPERRKTALILSGGGARGAYEVGVVKALLEHGVTFDLAIGTSIGAINAAFLAQGDIERWERMWCSLRSADVFHPLSVRRITQLLRGKHNGLLDNSPLEQLLRRELDLDRIKAGSTKVGWCMTDLCTQETMFVTADTMGSTDELIDTLMATSAVPLAFPPRAVGGAGLYIDGGLVRNTPMKFALEMGVKEIYAVLLNGNVPSTPPLHLMDCFDRIMDVILDSSARNAIGFAHFYNGILSKNAETSSAETMLRLHVLKPRKPMRINLLAFEPDKTMDIIAQGYEDTQDHLENIDCGQCENPSGENLSQHWY